MSKMKTKPELFIDYHEIHRVVVAAKREGVRWEIDIQLNPDCDGGIAVDIHRDDVVCTGCEFGWQDSHENA